MFALFPAFFPLWSAREYRVVNHVPDSMVTKAFPFLTLNHSRLTFVKTPSEYRQHLFLLYLPHRHQICRIRPFNVKKRNNKRILSLPISFPPSVYLSLYHQVTETQREESLFYFIFFIPGNQALLVPVEIFKLMASLVLFSSIVFLYPRRWWLIGSR